MNIAIGIILGALGIYLIVINAVIIYRQIRYKSSESWIPLLGGLFLFMALNFIPNRLPWYVKLMPFIIDWGCIPGLVHTAIYWIFVVPKKKREGEIR